MAIIGRQKTPHRRQCRQLPSMGAEKPLLEERCHEVTEWWQMRMLVVAIIGRPQKATPQTAMPTTPSMGAEKPLLEERCHEVTEWWQMRILVEANIGHPKSHPIVGNGDSSLNGSRKASLREASRSDGVANKIYSKQGEEHG